MDQDFGFSDDRRRELLKHFVTPELRQLAREILQPQPTATTTTSRISRPRQNHPSTTAANSSVSTSKPTPSRTQRYQSQRRARPAIKPASGRMKNSLKKKSTNQSIRSTISSSSTSSTSSTTTTTAAKERRPPSRSSLRPSSRSSSATPGEQQQKPLSPTSRSLSASFQLSHDELHHFQRIQRNHEQLLEAGRWEALWSRRRKLSSQRNSRYSSSSDSISSDSTSTDSTSTTTLDYDKKKCLANSRIHSYSLLLGRRPSEAALEVDNGIKITSSAATRAAVVAAAAVASATSRGSEKSHHHGCLASQRVLMDSTRLHNAAMDNSFLAKMLEEDDVQGSPSGRYMRNRERGRQRSSLDEVPSNEDRDVEVLDDDDFGGELDMTALGNIGGNIGNMGNIGGGGEGHGEFINGGFNVGGINLGQKDKTEEERGGEGAGSGGGDFMSGFEDEEEEEEKEKEKMANEVEMMVSAKEGRSGGQILLHSTGVRGGHIPFTSIPSAPTSGTISLSLPTMAKTTAPGMVFNSAKMCWEAAGVGARKEEEDVMAGFSSEEEEEEPKEKKEDDDFMAGFSDDDDDEEEETNEVQVGDGSGSGVRGVLMMQKTGGVAGGGEETEEEEEDFMAGFSDDDEVF